MKTNKTVVLSYCLVLVLGIFSWTNGHAQHQNMMKPADGSAMVMSSYPFMETLGKVKQAISEQGLMVIDDIDGQAMMKMAGKEIPPMHQIIFFHPRYMRKVYEANMMAGIVVPLKLIIMENKQGKTVIRYFKPSTLLEPYEGTGAVANELDKVVSVIVNTAKQ